MKRRGPAWEVRRHHVANSLFAHANPSYKQLLVYAPHPYFCLNSTWMARK